MVVAPVLLLSTTVSLLSLSSSPIATTTLTSSSSLLLFTTSTRICRRFLCLVGCLSTSSSLSNGFWWVGRNKNNLLRIPTTTTFITNKKVAATLTSSKLTTCFASSSSPSSDASEEEEDDERSYGLKDIGKTAATSNQQAKNDNNNTMATMSSWRELLELSNNLVRSQKIRGSNYVQLATVCPVSQEPRVRCIVFRGFLDVENLPNDHPLYMTMNCDNNKNLSCILTMTTDVQSEKVRHITTSSSTTTTTTNNNNAEIVWWFPNTTEQYRIRGRIVFVGSSQLFEYDNDETLSKARQQQWERMSDEARSSFFTNINHPPGTDYSSEPSSNEDDVDKKDKGDASSTNIPPPPDNFLLMLLIPNHVDYLRLTPDMYRQVDTYCRSQQQDQKQQQGQGEWISKRVNP